ncbi:hypothetical protein MNBD_UNCLBAC01-1741 [hydrothermal vent metagenome]|uniref:Methanolan biosynthesis EpsI domain-containing protein n=1 Tax=hydrothermal vent metagenome TaxID=652676 RepID=A0A3B1CYD8_9ZZZZ
MKNIRPILSTLILIATILICFLSPKQKYDSFNITSKLNIPHKLKDWRSANMSQQLNLEEKDDRYNFISSVFARLYGTRYQEKILFLILDAGNFHHPKVCFNSSGFTITELPDTELKTPNGIFKAKSILTLKNGEGFIVTYWIVINKKHVNWTEQKFKQLWFSLLNKKKVGLMMRIDIPTNEDNIEHAIKLSQKFIREMSVELSKKSVGYIFGE